MHERVVSDGKIDGRHATALEANQPGAMPAASVAGPAARRRPYEPPSLERLGEWTALTLQQSVPIFP